ncbi:hypothetical protein J3R30DRAFT_3291536 [Lentinula aciculospora]|uniref:Carbohydrate-binding module family 19 domain-containing protein n=1 Tax=Lentinula aciculospora TaxID=153920 RepID=A0A9W9AC22_9AGAR|nr:hypothetical protein J3R30DRAFT_3291536 [Lentinula aciculospora]
MARINILFVLSAALMASAAPLEKRIAQTIADSTTAWVAACTAAGGAGQCNTISQTAFTTLLAAGGNCDQQNAADSMIDLAKTLNNNPDMIRLAQIFVQQPRNAPDSLQVPYCQTAPKNAELNGLFHCQFASSDFTKFSGDQTGNVPLGLSAVNPPGSCPALDTPVPDGVQLNTLVTSPGTPQGSSAAGAVAPAANSTVSSASAPAAVPSSTSTTVDNVGAGAAPAAGASATSASVAPAVSSTTATDSSSSSASASGSQLQNGEDAIKLNSQFASLTSTSSCTNGEQACVGGGFAQCVGSTFQITQCSGGTQCFALPLVNKAGTVRFFFHQLELLITSSCLSSYQSITCTTQADANARIAATGATA